MMQRGRGGVRFTGGLEHRGAALADAGVGGERADLRGLGPAALALAPGARARPSPRAGRPPPPGATSLTMNRLARLPGNTRAARLVRAQRARAPRRAAQRRPRASRLAAICFAARASSRAFVTSARDVEQRLPSARGSASSDGLAPRGRGRGGPSPRCAGNERPGLVGGEGQHRREQQAQVARDAVEHGLRRAAPRRRRRRRSRAGPSARRGRRTTGRRPRTARAGGRRGGTRRPRRPRAPGPPPAGAGASA